MKKPDPDAPKRAAPKSSSGSGRYGSSGVRRSDYLDAEDYSRAIIAAGGPGPEESFCVPNTGHYAALLHATVGATPAERAAIAVKELEDEQRRRPHVFVQKDKPAGRRAKR